MRSITHRKFQIPLAIGLLAACGSPEPLQIGFLGGVSGRVADLGISGRNAVMLAVDLRNAAGGVNGHKIELQVDNFTDEECDEFFASGAYEENPIGIIFEPDEWIERYASGESPRLLTKRPLLPAGVAASAMIRN